MDYLSTNSMLMLEKSMGFLWTKQAAILDNVGNAETPGYKPKVVTFEEAFRTSLEDARKGRTPKADVRRALGKAEVTVEEPDESTRMDDNGVNVTTELVELSRNAYQQQYLMTAISGEINILRTAIRGQ